MEKITETRSTEKKTRIVFLDFIRAFAVLMMVQGHTVSTILKDSLRDSDYIVYSVWLFMRGATAPIFLMTSGTVFTFLLFRKQIPFKENVRVKKGIKRGFLLLFLGYLLRYPTHTLITFSEVSDSQWRIFFAVDVLHLIGIGIFALIFLSWLAQKFNWNAFVIFGLAIMLNLTLYMFTQNVEWKEFLPLPLANYFYRAEGSLFPLFPWLSYMFAGGLLGRFLALHQQAFRDIRFSAALLAIGIVLILGSLGAEDLEIMLTGESTFYHNPMHVLFRFGIVFVLYSVMSFLVIRITNIPEIILEIGRKTLLVYVVHLLIIYGSAWNPGFSKLWSHRLGTWETVGVALAMIVTMGLLVVLTSYMERKGIIFKKKN